MDGDPHTDQTQAAPKIQAGAMKATCSENQLLTTPKAWGIAVFLACTQTWWSGTSPKILNRNMGLRRTPNTGLPMSISAYYFSGCLSETFTRPTSEQKQYQSASRIT